MGPLGGAQAFGVGDGEAGVAVGGPGVHAASAAARAPPAVATRSVRRVTPVVAGRFSGIVAFGLSRCAEHGSALTDGEERSGCCGTALSRGGDRAARAPRSCDRR